MLFPAKGIDSLCTRPVAPRITSLHKIPHKEEASKRLCRPSGIRESLISHHTILVSISGGTDQIAFGTMSDERDDVFSAHFRWGLGRVYLTKQSFIADWESSTLDAALIEVIISFWLLFEYLFLHLFHLYILNAKHHQEMERELEIEEHECLFVAFDAVQIGKRAEPYYEIKQVRCLLFTLLYFIFLILYNTSIILCSIYNTTQ